jgi:hypothetical protein
MALVFVQTSPDEARARVVPAAIVPVRAGAGADGAGVDFAGVVVVFVGVLLVPVERVTGGAFVVELVAVSLSVRLSLLASAMFAASAESFLSAVESVFDESPEQATSAMAITPRDAAVIRV